MEDKFFTAEEARMISEEVSSDQMNKELEEIYKYINEARFKGCTTITLGKFYRNSTVAYLRAKGFKVEEWSGTQWDPCTDTKISW